MTCGRWFLNCGILLNYIALEFYLWSYLENWKVSMLGIIFEGGIEAYYGNRKTLDSRLGTNSISHHLTS